MSTKRAMLTGGHRCPQRAHGDGKNVDAQSVIPCSRFQASGARKKASQLYHVSALCRFVQETRHDVEMTSEAAMRQELNDGSKKHGEVPQEPALPREPVIRQRGSAGIAP